MSLFDIRSAVLKAAQGKIHLDHASCRPNEDGTYVLRITGWHRDGTKHGIPFAHVTAPFFGDPVQEAERVTNAIIASKQEGKPPMEIFKRTEPAVRPAARPTGGAVQPITNASGRIAKAFKRIAESVEGLAADAEAVAGSVDGTVEHGRAIIKDAANADRILREGLGLTGDNGGPLGPLDPEPNKP